MSLYKFWGIGYYNLQYIGLFDSALYTYRLDCCLVQIVSFLCNGVKSNLKEHFFFVHATFKNIHTALIKRAVAVFFLQDTRQLAHCFESVQLSSPSDSKQWANSRVSQRKQKATPLIKVFLVWKLKKDCLKTQVNWNETLLQK